MLTIIDVIISSQLFLLLLTQHTLSTNSSYWDASIDNEWQNQDINCISNQACTIICDTSYSCSSSRILCPKYHTCDIQCLTDNSCQDANITWPLIDGYGSLTCDGLPAYYSCQGITFPPPVSTLPLTITCDDSMKCLYSTILCPESATCTVQCLGDGACNGATIVWPLIAGYGTLICDGEVACRNTNFPDNPEPTTALTVYCDSRGECDDYTDIFCPESASCSIYCSAEQACYNTNIYCAEGQNCNVYCQHGQVECGFMKMYCKTNNLCNIHCSFSSSCYYTQLYRYSTSPGTITTHCDSTCDQIQYLTWTESPTSAPTNTPTTSNPTIYPTVDPTTDPTTNSPTVSPTICIDLNGTDTNDGYSIPIQQQIYHLSLGQEINDNNKIIISTQPGQYQDQLINLTHDKIQQITCSGFGSCVGTTIVAQNNTICNIECNGYLSCLDTIINIEQCNETEIICNGDKACDTSQINIHSDNNNDHISIKCGATSSCEDVYINITRDVTVNVTCYGFKACDGLTIDASIAISKDVYSYQHIHLEMMSYSDKVTLFNGFGYEEEDGSQQYVSCNTQDQYLEYPTNSLLQTSSELMIRAENGYEGQRLPCDNVQIGCFQPNSSDTSSCTMQYSISNTYFDISSSDISATCIWIPLVEFIDITCAGACASSPTKAPTLAPTDAPSAPSQPPTPDPTNNPTSDPTIDPTQEPTTDPTNDPTMDPIIDPTRDPTVDPTTEPTVEPTADPTNAPTTPPTNAPSYSPSTAPTSPPSAAPSRLPTKDVDEIYDVKIEIKYSCGNLTEANKKFIVDEPKQVINRITEILEMNYFTEGGLKYFEFWLLIIKINGVDITGYYDDSKRRLQEEILTYGNIETWAPENPVIFTVRIESENADGEVIIRATQDDDFRIGVQKGLRDLFGNNYLLFSIESTADELEAAEQPKFEEDEEEDSTVLVISICIVSAGVLTSGIAFLYNMLPGTTVDNSIWIAPFFIALAMYDLISDVNLCIIIFKHDETKASMHNGYFILAVASIIFVILPLVVNLLYAMRIKREATIQNSPSARAWFENRLAKFILLCIFCAGTYPVLTLTSSRLFGLDFFNAGLLSSDLHVLSKIKLISTVGLENAPQLLIQIAYSYAIGKWENATILAFVASSLSILASLAVYYAQRQGDDSIKTKYFLLLEANQSIGAEQEEKIKFNKGLKAKLRDSLCSGYDISKESIEVGYITQNDKGCRIHLQHTVSKNEMSKVKNQLLQNQLNVHKYGGYTIEITEDMYFQQVIRYKNKQILDAILKHFELENDDEIEYNVYYQSGDGVNSMESDNNISSAFISNMEHTLQYGGDTEMVQLNTKQMIGDDEISNDMTIMQRMEKNVHEQMRMLQLMIMKSQTKMKESERPNTTRMDTDDGEEYDQKEMEEDNIDEYERHLSTPV